MNGFINVIKPVGATASDVVVKLKFLLQEKKIGHLGTLDPGASGVLPIAVGQATRLFDFLTDKVKYYRAFFTFGKTTDTLDAYGVLTESSDVIPDENAIKGVLTGFVGEFDQIPPVYSAKSVGGVRSYKLARSGAEVELKPKRVSIYEIRLISQKSDDTFVVDIKCSAGTYIRSLARDIAQACGTVGYMSGLIRLRSGCFDIQNAYTLDEIAELKDKTILDISYPLSDVERLDLPDSYYQDLDCGRKIPCPFNDGYKRIFCNNVFFGLGKNVDGNLKIQYYLKNAGSGV